MYPKSILISSLHSISKESICTDSSTDSNKTKTVSSSAYTPISMTVFTLLGDSKAMIVIIVPPVIFGQRKASTLGSSTHTTPLSISSISKLKDNN